MERDYGFVFIGDARRIEATLGCLVPAITLETNRSFIRTARLTVNKDNADDPYGETAETTTEQGLKFLDIVKKVEDKTYVDHLITTPPPS